MPRGVQTLQASHATESATVPGDVQNALQHTSFTACRHSLSRAYLVNHDGAEEHGGVRAHPLDQAQQVPPG